MKRIFVYGTLRRGGKANHLLKEAELLHSSIQLSGYKMLDAGWYPVVIPSATEADVIVGDVYEIAEELVSVLDEYEGEGYEKGYLEAYNAFLYLGKRNLWKNLPPVPGGDWLLYFEEK